MIAYKPNHFRIEELVSPELFEQFRDRQHILWQQFDSRRLYSLDMLRELFGSTTINNWVWEGKYVSSGLRLSGDSHYSPTSQHSHGRGFDLKFRDEKPEILRAFIIRNPQDERLKYITCIEKDTPTWLHIDCRNHDKDKFGVLQVPWR